MPLIDCCHPYLYSHMKQDIHTLCKAWPKLAKASAFGTSVLGYSLPVLVLGNPTSQIQLLFQGAIHGREYTTTRVLMAQALHLLEKKQDLLEKACFHFLPMINPDGVQISQKKALPPCVLPIYENDKAAGYGEADRKTYARRYKANAQGIDLNRNFNAGWAVLKSRENPSCSHYKGWAPFCAPETRALAAYTRRYTFLATVSYHETGSLIYWDYGTRTEVIAEGRRLGELVSSYTGYPLVSDPGLDSGGYKDWAMEVLGIPSLTIEIGNGEAPLGAERYPEIREQNLEVPAAVAFKFLNS